VGVTGSPTLARLAYFIVVIVLFGYDIDEEGRTIPNNYVATAFFKFIQLKG